MEFKMSNPRKSQEEYVTAAKIDREALGQREKQ